MIAITLGTRPEIIKMAPVIRACKNRFIDYIVIHTGQHYSYELDGLFFDELELPRADYELKVGSDTDAAQTGKMLASLGEVLSKEEPDVVLAEGDTNSVFASAFAATKLHIEVGHVEAGLRSYDRYMPEEINRVLTDHISDFLFAPTEDACHNLLNEGIDKKKIFVTGNTIVDAVSQNLNIAEKRSVIFGELGIDKDNYFVCTTHRAENVDNKERLSGILEGLTKLHTEFGRPIIFPMHPRTKKRIESFGLSLDEIHPTAPIGFLEFLLLEAHAELVVTDSGGVQEEACVLQVPCITVRDNTERPETLKVGSNILVGTEPERILDGAKTILSGSHGWQNPFGNGDSGEQIVSILQNHLMACDLNQ